MSRCFTILLSFYKAKGKWNKVTHFTCHQISQITEVDLERFLQDFFKISYNSLHHTILCKPKLRTECGNKNAGDVHLSYCFSSLKEMWHTARADFSSFYTSVFEYHFGGLVHGKEWISMFLDFSGKAFFFLILLLLLFFRCFSQACRMKRNPSYCGTDHHLFQTGHWGERSCSEMDQPEHPADEIKCNSHFTNICSGNS